MPVQPIPEGFHTLTPYIIVEGALELVDFLKQVFDAKEVELVKLPDGALMHAELLVGTSMLMLGDAHGTHPIVNAMLYAYVEDVDAIYKRAIEAGAISVREPRDEFYGDRTGGVKDKWGNQWWFATHIEDLTHEEIMRRGEEMQK